MSKVRELIQAINGLEDGVDEEALEDLARRALELESILDKYPLKSVCEKVLPLLDHIGSAECSCDHSVGLRCEVCYAAHSAADIRRALAAT